MVVLEAMAAGVPVVATRVEGSLRSDSRRNRRADRAARHSAGTGGAIERFIRGDVDWSTVRASAHRRHGETIPIAAWPRESPKFIGECSDEPARTTFRHVHRSPGDARGRRPVARLGPAPADFCRYVVTPNVDHAVLFQSHAGLRDAYADARLVLADGMPVVSAAGLLGRRLPERVTGSDLVPALFTAAQQRGGLRVFCSAPRRESASGRREDRRALAGGAGVRRVQSAARFRERPGREREILARIAMHGPTCWSSVWAPQARTMGTCASRPDRRTRGAVRGRDHRLSGRRRGRRPGGCARPASSGCIGWPANRGGWCAATPAMPGFFHGSCSAKSSSGPVAPVPNFPGDVLASSSAAAAKRSRCGLGPRCGWAQRGAGPSPCSLPGGRGVSERIA